MTVLNVDRARLQFTQDLCSNELQAQSPRLLWLGVSPSCAGMSRKLANRTLLPGDPQGGDEGHCELLVMNELRGNPVLMARGQRRKSGAVML